MAVCLILLSSGTVLANEETTREAESLSDSLTPITFEGTYWYEEAWQVLELVNQERAKAGLSPMTMDKELLTSAMTRAAEVQVDFSHVRPDGTSFSSISDKVWSENIAAGNRTAEETVKQWMDSPGHRANILTPEFTTLGVGCFTQGRVCYWVQLFGTSDAEFTDDRTNRDTVETVKVLRDNVRCQMDNFGSYYSLLVGGEEDYEGKFVLLNNGWGYAVTWMDPTSILWSSSDESVFRVDERGHLKGIGEGSAVLTGQLKADSTVQGTLEVRVSPDNGIGNYWNRYSDVDINGWYYDYVSDVTAKGLMTGYDDGRFGVADNLSRGQFATVMYRMADRPDVQYSGVFPDVEDGWFYSLPAEWTNLSGVMTGYENGNFGPVDNLTREQLVTIMYRYAKLTGQDTSARAEYSGFPDGYKVSGFASEGMKWAVAKGIIKGNGDKTLDPQGNVSRAVCATVISRYTSSSR